MRPEGEETVVGDIKRGKRVRILPSYITFCVVAVLKALNYATIALCSAKVRELLWIMTRRCKIYLT